MKIIINMAFAILISIATYGATLPDYPFIYTNAMGEVDTAPDLARIYFEIVVYHDKSEPAFEEQKRIADIILRYLEGKGVAREDTEADSVRKNIIKEKDKEYNDIKIKCYETKRSVRVLVRNLSVYKDVIEFLYKQDNVGSISTKFESTKNEELRKQALEKAISKCNEKAETICKSFGIATVAVRAISENGFEVIDTKFGFSRENRDGSYSSANLKVDFEAIPVKINISRMIYVIYELKK